VKEKKYDTTIARMAGNIAAGLVGRGDLLILQKGLFATLAHDSVALARAIVAEVERTEPSAVDSSTEGVSAATRTD
jgi:hypothetical protein